MTQLRYRVKRSFCKPVGNGFCYYNDILTDLPEQFVTDWTALGLIELIPEGEPDAVGLPDKVILANKPKLLRQKPTGKPKNTKTK